MKKLSILLSIPIILIFSCNGPADSNSESKILSEPPICLAFFYGKNDDGWDYNFRFYQNDSIKISIFVYDEDRDAKTIYFNKYYPDAAELPTGFQIIEQISAMHRTDIYHEIKSFTNIGSLQPGHWRFEFIIVDSAGNEGVCGAGITIDPADYSD